MPRSQTCGRPPTLGVTNVTSDRHRDPRGAPRPRASVSGRDRGPEEFLTEVLGVVEINADDRIAAVVVFDLDDFDAAIAELDARYLAGEAAAHARTWSVIRAATPRSTGTSCQRRRRTGSTSTTDAETAFGPGDLIAYIRAGSDLDQDNKAYVEAVHRLTDLGAVVTYAAHETSQEGFDAEWRGIAVLDGRRRHDQPR